MIDKTSTLHPAIAAYLRGDRVADIVRTHHLSVHTLMRLLYDAGVPSRRYARLDAMRAHILAGAAQLPPRTINQRAVLDAIRAAEPGATITTIATRAGVSASFVSRLVRRWHDIGVSHSIALHHAQ